MSNLQVLVSVPSFDRWPLKLHFFSKDAFKSWKDAEAKAVQSETTSSSVQVLQDFGPTEESGESEEGKPWGIHALPLDYTRAKEYIEKAHNAALFEREGKCVHCKENLESGRGLYPMCSNEGCDAMGHLDCWGQHALGGKDADQSIVIPQRATCPSCGGDIKWGDMMMELSLRTRGQTEVEKLLKKGRKAKAKTS